MLAHALKEWAVICQALADGRQALLLRKGGIAESSGEFQVEHRKFWLFPTYVHQQESGIQPEARDLLREAVAQQPPPGTIRLCNFAEVTGIYWVKDLFRAQMLAHLHVWSEKTVEQRFAYRQPGLFVLSVRVYRAPGVFELPDRPEYAGCKSWVSLERELPTEGAKPVLSDKAMKDVEESLSLLLHPAAYV